MHATIKRHPHFAGAILLIAGFFSVFMVLLGTGQGYAWYCQWLGDIPTQELSMASLLLIGLMVWGGLFCWALALVAALLLLIEFWSGLRSTTGFLGRWLEKRTRNKTRTLSQKD